VIFEVGTTCDLVGPTRSRRASGIVELDGDADLLLDALRGPLGAREPLGRGPIAGGVGTKLGRIEARHGSNHSSRRAGATPWDGSGSACVPGVAGLAGEVLRVREAARLEAMTFEI